MEGVAAHSLHDYALGRLWYRKPGPLESFKSRRRSQPAGRAVDTLSMRRVQRTDRPVGVTSGRELSPRRPRGAPDLCRYAAQRC